MIKEADWNKSPNQRAIKPKPVVLVQDDEHHNQKPDKILHGIAGLCE
jgi:hypothetical protein